MHYLMKSLSFIALFSIGIVSNFCLESYEVVTTCIFLTQDTKKHKYLGYRFLFFVLKFRKAIESLINHTDHYNGYLWCRYNVIEIAVFL